MTISTFCRSLTAVGSGAELARHGGFRRDRKSLANSEQSDYSRGSDGRGRNPAAIVNDNAGTSSRGHPLGETGAFVHDELSRQMPQWIKEILAEWAMIKAAPRSFAIVTIISVGAAWVALSWSYGALLSGKDAQIAVLRERISAYEQKLQGAAPDQAGAKTPP
jgi:hypothetical protein